MSSRLSIALALCGLLTSVASAQAGFVHWESPHVHPLERTPDGARLLAVNTVDARLEHRTVLLLDNVHDVNDDVYQAISQLWSSQNRWSMLLSVDDESIVNLPRWIIDQCELKIDLPSWDLGQTADYFDFAQNQAEGNGDIFNAQAITRIQELSDGIPRKIVQIAELALVAGAVRKSERVTSELVDQVCEEFTVSIGGKFPIILEDQRLNAG